MVVLLRKEEVWFLKMSSRSLCTLHFLQELLKQPKYKINTRSSHDRLVNRSSELYYDRENKIKMLLVLFLARHARVSQIPSSLGHASISSKIFTLYVYQLRGEKRKK